MAYHILATGMPIIGLAALQECAPPVGDARHVVRLFEYID